MPTYEYRCQECGKESEQYLSINEHDRGKITCRECKSLRQEPPYGAAHVGGVRENQP